MKIAAEKFSDWFMEAQPLFAAHYRESVRDPMALAPDFGVAIKLELAGVVRAFTVRDEGALVGYAIFLVTPHLHHKRDVVALCDVIYVKPSHRAPRVALRLLRTAEAQLTEEGVSRMQMREPAHDRSIGRLAESVGYELSERVYEKSLTKPPLKAVVGL